MARPRLHDSGYLAFLRQKPCCCGCGRAAPSEAAHVRIGFGALGKKPDDRFAVPLNAQCHGEQHTMNESVFWGYRALNPFAIAERLYAEYGGLGGAPRKKRKPRQTIRPKGFSSKLRTKSQWPRKGSRKLSSRKFSASSKSAARAD